MSKVASSKNPDINTELTPITNIQKDVKKIRLPKLPTVSNIKKFAGNKNPTLPNIIKNADVKVKIGYIKYKLLDGSLSNIFSRIIIISTSFIIFEKFLEDKKKKIKLFTNGNNNIKTKLLEVIYIEFWYLPFMILVYNLLIIIVIYTIFFSIYMLMGNAGNGNGNDNGNAKNNLFNIDIFKELFYIFFITFIANLIILILIYYILVVLSNENVSLYNKITDEFLDKFYSYYRFSYYSIILFLFIYISIS
jgi:hypothetical protein